MRCLYPNNCQNTARTRGLCHGHYQTMRDRVRKGKVTEEDLEARGLMTPKFEGGGFSAPDSLGAFVTGSSIKGRRYEGASEKTHVEDLVARLCDAASDHEWIQIHEVMLRIGYFWDCDACDLTNNDAEGSCSHCGEPRER